MIKYENFRINGLVTTLWWFVGTRAYENRLVFEASLSFETAASILILPCTKRTLAWYQNAILKWFVKNYARYGAIQDMWMKVVPHLY